MGPPSNGEALHFARIRLKNWRNFLDIDVPLQQRVFLVGPNASGKSNFLDAFRFPSDIVTVGGGFQEAVVINNVLKVDPPKDGIFAPFGDARCKIEGGEAVKSREMYLAIYQALARDERRPGLYREFPTDFFDLVIVGECHRGSARNDSNWREMWLPCAPAPRPLRAT